MKVLIADDDSAFVRLASAQLQARGIDVSVAHDLAQARLEVQRSSPDAVLLDVSRRGGGGETLVRDMKSWPATCFVPVIAVSGSADPELPKRMLDLGADAFLPKPLDFEGLFRALEVVSGYVA